MHVTPSKFVLKPVFVAVFVAVLEEPHTYHLSETSAQRLSGYSVLCGEPRKM